MARGLLSSGKPLDQRGTYYEPEHYRPPLPTFEVMIPAWFTTYENMRRDLHAVFWREGVRVRATCVKTGVEDDIAGFVLLLEGREVETMKALAKLKLGSLEVNGQLVETGAP